MRTEQPCRVTIIADDLTSAADGAAPFVERGWTAMVGRGRAPGQAGDVLAVDCGSRSGSPSEAAARVGKLTTQLAACEVLYKTVDSTLRGHVTAELDACFKASGRRTLVFGPAFPAAGRTTVGGIQLVDAVPVAQSVYARDPVHPARESALAKLVPDSIKSVILLDASSQAELDATIAAMPDPASILWVGSPGMALALARRFAPVGGPAAAVAAIDGDVLVVVGSANPRSQRQADDIDRMPGVTLLRAPREREHDPGAVLRRIAAEAVQVLQRGRFEGLIATGGDTMEAILDLLKVREFEVLQELQPGFPLGRATLDAGRHLLLAMKAGGFGDDNAMLRAVAQLRAQPHTPSEASA